MTSFCHLPCPTIFPCFRPFFLNRLSVLKISDSVVGFGLVASFIFQQYMDKVGAFFVHFIVYACKVSSPTCNFWFVLPLCAYLNGRIANTCCRRLLRHICVRSTHTEPTWGLYFTYAERALVTVFGRECIMWRDQQSKHFRYTPNLHLDHVRLHASSTIDGLQIVPSAQFYS